MAWADWVTTKVKCKIHCVSHGFGIYVMILSFWLSCLRRWWCSLADWVITAAPPRVSPTILLYMTPQLDSDLIRDVPSGGCLFYHRHRWRRRRCRPTHYNGNHEKIYTRKIKNLIGGKSDELSSVDVILIYFLVYFRLTWCAVTTDHTMACGGYVHIDIKHNEAHFQCIPDQFIKI